MHEDLKDLATQALIDMLARRTSQFTNKNAEFSSVERQQYEYEIVMIQSELNSRKQMEGNTNISDTDIKFSSETN